MILTEEQARRAQAGTSHGEKALGYWSNSGRLADLPMPQDFIDETWRGPVKAMVVAHLKRGSIHEQWMGSSSCRICKCRNGSKCLTDGTYVWPEGFAHYVEAHGVNPPQEFIDHVKNLDPDLLLELERHQAFHEQWLADYRRQSDPENCPVRGEKCVQKGPTKCFIEHPEGGSSGSYACQHSEGILREALKKEETRHKKRLHDLVRPDDGYTYMVQQALRRPADYASLPARQQWALDKSLGILDWEPTPAEEAEYTKRWAAKVEKWKETPLQYANEPERSARKLVYSRNDPKEGA